MLTVRRFSGVPADPFLLWKQLHPRPRHGFFLGSAAATREDFLVYMSVGEPVRVLSAVPLVHAAPGLDRPRFVGALSFEAGRAFEPALVRQPRWPDPLRTPAALFGDYRSVLKVDYKKKETTLFFEGGKERREELCRLIKDSMRFPSPSGEGLGVGQSPPPGLPPSRTEFISNNVGTVPSNGFQYRAVPLGGGKSPRPLIDHQFPRFRRMVLRAKEAIARGDIYQANLSLLFQARFGGDPVELYQALCSVNPSPYACLIKQAGRWVVSCSPELLLSVDGRAAATRPIAGTRPRGKSRGEDRQRQGQLLLSPKERAEHIMLVDLERNDLGRVCSAGSVRVPERFVVERYSHVMHIVSEVRGRLRAGVGAEAALAAVFPGGTITGCPKIRSVGIIGALERAARGHFYGSAGYFSWKGNAKFNILIRTAVVKNGRAFVRAGAGIVADSDPRREYNEVLVKAQVLRELLESRSVRAQREWNGARTLRISS